MYYGSKGWYVKELREKGIKVHPDYRDHLSKYKRSELARLYNSLINKSNNSKSKGEIPNGETQAV